MPPARRQPASPAAAARASVWVGVAALHAVVLVSAGLWAAPVARDDRQGAAPVINLSLEPAPRFDSERPPSLDSTARAARTGGAPTPARAPLRLRHPDAPPPSSPLTAPQAAPLIAQAAQSTETPATPRAGPAAPAGAEPLSGSAASGENASVAGATQDGGGPTLGAAAAPQQDPYAAQVLAWVERHKRHPGGARGVVTVHFQLDRQGRVHGLRLTRSSGVRALDRAALDQISAAQPFPRPGPGATWRTRPFTFNIDYRTAP